jgi:hypothetical protein
MGAGIILAITTAYIYIVEGSAAEGRGQKPPDPATDPVPTPTFRQVQPPPLRGAMDRIPDVGIWGKDEANKRVAAEQVQANASKQPAKATPQTTVVTSPNGPPAAYRSAAVAAQPR